jgi:hypothetical protein
MGQRPGQVQPLTLWSDKAKGQAAFFKRELDPGGG